MDTDLPDFASDAHASAPDASQVQEPVAATPAPAAQQDAAPAITPEPAALAQPDPANPAPSAADQAAALNVPLATFLDMRDRANAATNEAKALREWRQQQEAAARRQPPPSRDEDPDAYEAHQQQQVQQALYVQRRDFSRSMAEIKHGEEVTKTAFEWGATRCDEDPFFNQKVMASADPVGFVVSEWKREQLLTRIDPADLDAFQAWKAAQAGQPPAPAQQAAPGSPGARPAAPRPSLAAAPSAGASADPAVRDGEQQFGAMFGTG